jgi:hypothetical protein
MLLDHRTYTVRPGTLKLQLELYAAFGFEPQKRHLGAPLAFLVTESGELNTYVHIWTYADAADRMRRRASLQTDVDWLGYAEKAAAAGYITRQDTKLMTPAFFAPLELPRGAGAQDAA